MIEQTITEVPTIEQMRGESDEDYLRRCAIWALDQGTVDGAVDRVTAANHLEQLARHNPHLLFLLTHDVLAKQCWEVVRRHLGYVRNENWQEMVAEGNRILNQDVAVATEPAASPIPFVRPAASIAPAAPAAPTPNTAMYGGVGKSVFDTYTIPGRAGESIKLGDATRADLRYAIAQAEGRIRGNIKHALMWRQLERRLPDDQTRVRAVVSEEDVARASANADAAALAALQRIFTDA